MCLLFLTEVKSIVLNSPGSEEQQVVHLRENHGLESNPASGVDTEGGENSSLRYRQRPFPSTPRRDSPAEPPPLPPSPSQNFETRRVIKYWLLVSPHGDVTSDHMLERGRNGFERQTCAASRELGSG